MLNPSIFDLHLSFLKVLLAQSDLKENQYWENGWEILNCLIGSRIILLFELDELYNSFCAKPILFDQIQQEINVDLLWSIVSWEYHISRFSVHRGIIESNSTMIASDYLLCPCVLTLIQLNHLRFSMRRFYDLLQYRKFHF